MTLATTLQPLHAWWQARNGRERLLVLGGGIASLLLAADAAVTAPMEKRLKREHTELQAQRARLDGKRPAGADGGDAPQRRAQEQRLRARLAAAQAAMQALEQRAGEAARLPEMLRAITATVDSVRVLALDLGDDPASAAAPPGGDARRLYRLPITLKVSGTYDELQTLLAQVDRHAAALQWSSLALDAAQWPAIQLTLKAHVPSLAPRWGSTP